MYLKQGTSRLHFISFQPKPTPFVFAFDNSTSSLTTIMPHKITTFKQSPSFPAYSSSASFKHRRQLINQSIMLFVNLCKNIMHILFKFKKEFIIHNYSLYLNVTCPFSVTFYFALQIFIFALTQNKGVTFTQCTSSIIYFMILTRFIHMHKETCSDNQIAED